MFILLIYIMSLVIILPVIIIFELTLTFSKWVLKILNQWIDWCLNHI